MRAVVYTRYGPPEVLQLQEVAKPAPKENEVLIKVRATTVHHGDVIMRSLDVPGPWWQRLASRLFLGVVRPKRSILGMELAGEVEAVGRNVTRYVAGDHVFACTLWSDFGAYAEYKCMPEDGMLALKPANLSYEEAAPLSSGGLTALVVLRKADIQRGCKVLIYGASGSVGTFAVQLVKYYGAHVTGVCSTANVEMVRSLGADVVIDRTWEDFTATGGTYDVIFDAVDKMSPAQRKASQKMAGTYLSVGRDSGSRGDADPQDLVLLKELAEAGKLRAVIDRRYPLKQIVEAHRYVNTERKAGNVVITLGAS